MVTGGSPGMWLLGQSDDGTPRVWSLGQNETVVLCTNHGWGNFTNFWRYIQKSIVEKGFSPAALSLCHSWYQKFTWFVRNTALFISVWAGRKTSLLQFLSSQMCKFYNILHTQLLTAQFFLKLVIGSGSRKVLELVEATFDSTVFWHCSQQLLFPYSVWLFLCGSVIF